MKPYIKPNDDRDYTDTIQFQKKKTKMERIRNERKRYRKTNKSLS